MPNILAPYGGDVFQNVRAALTRLHASLVGLRDASSTDSQSSWAILQILNWIESARPHIVAAMGNPAALAAAQAWVDDPTYDLDAYLGGIITQRDVLVTYLRSVVPSQTPDPADPPGTSGFLEVSKITANDMLWTRPYTPAQTSILRDRIADLLLAIEVT